MRVLILDDDLARHHLLGTWLDWKFGAEHVSLHSEYEKDGAIVALARQEFDLIYLDHDLGDGSRDASGAHVARWLSEHPDSQRDAKIIVHSMNPPGAQRMMGWLADRPKAKAIPFAYLGLHA